MIRRLLIKEILFFGLLVVSTNIFPQNILSLSDTTVNTYDDFYLHIYLSNTDTITGFQFDIIFPESVQYLDSLIKSARFTDHIISVGEIEPGRIRLICFSLTNSALLDTTGKLLSLLYNAGGEAGTFIISFDNATLANINSQNVLDSTRNGVLTVSGVTDINSLPSIENSLRCNIYPNPFNNSTVLNYYTSTLEPITLFWYSLLGEKVNTEIIQPQFIGWNKSLIYAMNMSSGIYIIYFQNKEFTDIVKVLLMK